MKYLQIIAFVLSNKDIRTFLANLMDILKDGKITAEERKRIIHDALEIFINLTKK